MSDALKFAISKAMPNNPALQGWASYSQYDEDGIIRECLSRIEKKFPLSKTFVEIGCGQGIENNSHQLLLEKYTGVWFDADQENISFIKRELGNMIFSSLLVIEEKVDRARATMQAQKTKLFLNTTSVDFFSLDIDGNDFHVCDPFIVELNPKLICVEYNAIFPPPQELVMDYNESHEWDGSDYFGVSLQAWVNKFENIGYKLVACNITGANAFFVRSDLTTEFTIYSPHELYQPPRYHLVGQKPGHPRSLKWLQQQLKSGKDTNIKCIVANYGHMLIDTRDCVIGRSLAEQGTFQEQEISTVKSFIFDRFSNELNTFIDIGANIGTHTIYSLKKAGFNQALSFEPNIENFQLLTKNIAINNIADRVKCFHSALSNTSGVIEMELSNTNFGDHRIKAPQGTPISFGEELERRTCSVPADTLDELATKEGFNWQNALVWLDTQGHEGYIFSGGKTFFQSRSKPRFIVSEYWPYGIERCGGKKLYFDFLEKCSSVYDLAQTENNDFKKVTVNELLEMYEEMLRNTEKENHPHTNLLLVLP